MQRKTVVLTTEVVLGAWIGSSHDHVWLSNTNTLNFVPSIITSAMKPYALFVTASLLLLTTWFLDPKRPVPSKSSLICHWNCILIRDLQFIVNNSVGCVLSVYPSFSSFRQSLDQMLFFLKAPPQWIVFLVSCFFLRLPRSSMEYLL